MNGGPQARVSSPAPSRSTLITSAPRSASSCPAHGPARMRASSTTRRPASGPGMSMSPGSSVYGEACDRRLVDLDAEARRGRQPHQAVAKRKRTLDEVVRQIEVGEADAPVHARYRASKMRRRRTGDARLGDLGCDVYRQAELLAQPAGLERRADAAELDQLERDATGAVARARLDVRDGVDAFVDADRHAQALGQRLQAGEIVMRQRLLDEHQLRRPRLLDVAPRRHYREAAIG